MIRQILLFLRRLLTWVCPAGKPPSDRQIDPMAETVTGNEDASPQAGDFSIAPEAAVRCPVCHEPLPPPDAGTNQQVCPTCGGSFRIAWDEPSQPEQHRRLAEFELVEYLGGGSYGN